MSECLVTKLKGTVDDDSLFGLGEMRVTVVASDSGSSFQFSINSSVDQQLSVVGGDKYFSEDDSSWVSSIDLSAGSNKVIYLKNKDFTFRIPNKYALTSLGGGITNSLTDDYSYSIDDLKYANGLTHIVAGNMCTGDISSLAGKKMSVILPRGANVTGTVADYANIELLSDSANVYLRIDRGITGKIGDLANSNLISRFYNLQFYNGNITGSFDDISDKMPNLNSLLFKGTAADKTQLDGTFDTLTSPINSIELYDTTLAGTIEGFVATQRAQGRTTGSVSMTTWRPTNITFNGEVITGEGLTLSWTETQISFNGNTITA